MEKNTDDMPETGYPAFDKWREGLDWGEESTPDLTEEPSQGDLFNEPPG